MAILITGVAGCVGSNLAKAKLSENEFVFGIDNLSLGSLKNINKFITHPKFSFSQADLAVQEVCEEIIGIFHKQNPITEVWHLAANSDIAAGIADPNIDLRNTFMTTFNTINIMKTLEIKTLLFSSSSAIYGDKGTQLLTEESGPYLPISNYGAMKLASEALISVAAEQFLEAAYIFRFPNIVGTPATHGVLLDLIRKIKKSKMQLEVLGNGEQQKIYLHVDELVDAMMFIQRNVKEKLSIFNIGTSDEGVKVRVIAEELANLLSPNIKIQYGTSSKGWSGDVPQFRYSNNKLKQYGWTARWDSQAAVSKAILEIIQQEGL